MAPRVELMNYDRPFWSRWAKSATYIFADLDRLGYWDLTLAADLYLQLKKAGLSVWNDPARFQNRYTLLRALHAAGLNDFNAYRSDEIDSIRRFPVFLREIHGHGNPLTGLLETREDAARAVDAAIDGGRPLENLVLIELAAEPIREGLYCKQAAFRIGNAIVPHVAVHDTTWLVKYGRTFDLAIEDVYKEEHAVLEENPFADHLRKVFDIAGIEYGRADFGFYQGRLQVFEINTNPLVGRVLESHPSATRVATMKLALEKYMAAMRAIDGGGKGLVRLPGGRLERRRLWMNLVRPMRQVY